MESLSNEYKPNVIHPVYVPEGSETKENTETSRKKEYSDNSKREGITKELSVDEKPLSLIDKYIVIGELNAEKIVEMNIDNSAEKVKVIDTVIKMEIEKHGWKLNVKSYKEALQIIKNKLGITENETPLSQINKMHTILKIVLEGKLLEEKVGITLNKKIKW